MTVMTGLLDALVDDAGLFPPTSLDMRSAVDRHRGDLAAAAPMLTHRLLCPAARIGELIAELSAGDRLRVILIGGDDPARTQDAIDQVVSDGRLTLAAVEWAVTPLARHRLGDGPPSKEQPREGSLGEALQVALHALDASQAGPQVPLFAEAADISAAPAMTAALAGRPEAERPVGLKLRCGGVRAELFPAPADLAAAFVVAARAGIAVKATAGLHHAVRHVDQATGFTHYGFLNVLLASAQAQRGRPVSEVEAVLRDDDAERLATLARSFTTEEVRLVRAGFFSYGSCDTSLPVREAAGLGLSV
ncbi:hypothetical protein Psi02_38500 [Planotetraspora silvatica]|uniref:Uncharacterized protein n=1 Tax=Planotetraspora silvatica TaxID=234614 RepID=A0A8J3UN30_9ACTN|nr:hypothetical protein [Planotetraspora silvatica]GII47426.1 hypothetical protein Psi02_38500 [Planotetraspora silvatica]